MHICEATGWPPPYPSLQPASLVFNQVYLRLPLFFTSQEKSPLAVPSICLLWAHFEAFKKLAMV